MKDSPISFAPAPSTGDAAISIPAPASPPDTENPHYTRIRPERGLLEVDFAEIWRYRELLWALATRDIKLRYRQTALGAIWVILQPVMAAGVFTLIFGVIANLSSGDTNYFLFSFSGLLGWNVFNATLSKVSSSILSNAGMVAKVYFPRLILPLSVLLSVLIDFCVAMGLQVILMVIFKVVPGPGILLLPVWIAFLMALALGAGLIAASLIVKYRDVGYAIPVLINLLLFASPVAFSLAAGLDRLHKKNIYHLDFLFYINPLSGLIEGMRWSLIGEGMLRPSYIAYSMTCSVVVLIVGLIAFERQKRWFADII